MAYTILIFGPPAIGRSSRAIGDCFGVGGVSRPSGTLTFCDWGPHSELWGYFRMSLRDNAGGGRVRWERANGLVERCS